jgi:hypothetical protein
MWGVLLMLDRRELLGGAVAGATALAGVSRSAHAQVMPTENPAWGPVLEKNGLRYRYVFSVSVFFRERIQIDSPYSRAFVPAIGGEIWGPRLSGIVVPYGGADFGGGGGPLDAHYMFRADDGTPIYINNRGYMKRIGSRASVERTMKPRNADGTFDQTFVAPPDSAVPLRMRTSPYFEAPSDSAHAWMNSTVFIGHGLRRTDPDRTVFTYYEVL